MRTFTLTVMFALAIQGGVAFAQQNKQKEATIVSGMTVEIDSEGKAVIITPRSEFWCATAACNHNKWRKASRRRPGSHHYPSRGRCR